MGRFRIQVEETADGPLRSLTQGLSDMITTASTWVKENPRLTQTIILVVGGALALVAVIGAASLAMGILIGPLTKLQLGFSLLTGGRGILGTIAAFRTRYCRGPGHGECQRVVRLTVRNRT
jgi:hypothetical protein